MRLWWAQLISQFGDRINQMALIGLIAERAAREGSAWDLAKLISFTILPVFIIQPFAGVLVDRWDRRTTLFLSDLIRSALVFAIAFVFIDYQSMLPIYCIVFLVFSFSRFYIPAKMSIIPDIVEEDDLLMANSLVSTTGMIAAVLGFSIGSLIEYWGVKTGFIVDAGTFLLSGMIIFSMNIPKKLKNIKDELIRTSKDIIGPIRKSIFAEIKGGFFYLIHHKEIRFIIFILFVLLAGVGAVYIPIIVFIQRVFHSSTRHIAAPAVALGVGLFVGVLLYGRLGKKAVWYKTIFTSLMLGGMMLTVFTLGVYRSGDIWITMFLAFFMGIVIGPIFIEANRITHIVSDDEMRGKVFGALEIVIHAGFLMTMLISSLIADMLGPFWILMSVGCIFSLLGLIGLLFAKKLKLSDMQG